MNKSDSIQNLAVALVAFQKQMPKVKFDKTNPFIKNGYASLGAVLSAAVPAMTAHGLALSQFPIGDEGEVGVMSILMHESGEWISDEIMLKPEVQKPLTINQASGVTITYLRRYAASAILGLVADDDTDGDDGSNADKAVKNMMTERHWKTEQTEAVSTISLDAGHPLSGLDAQEILDLSALPQDAPVKTVQSWFKKYLASEGNTPLNKAAEANAAYIEAKKKSTGGK